MEFRGSYGKKISVTELVWLRVSRYRPGDLGGQGPSISIYVRKDASKPGVCVANIDARSASCLHRMVGPAREERIKFFVQLVRSVHFVRLFLSLRGYEALVETITPEVMARASDTLLKMCGTTEAPALLSNGIVRGHRNYRRRTLRR
jgi:hypothetical protein